MSTENGGVSNERSVGYMLSRCHERCTHMSSSLSTGPGVVAFAADLLVAVAGAAVQLVQAVAFWLAVAFPALYVPLLLDGLSLGSDLLPFVALLVANVAALVVGHGHRRDAVDGR